MNNTNPGVRKTEVEGLCKVTMNPKTYKLTVTIYLDKYDVEHLILEKGIIPKKSIANTFVQPVVTSKTLNWKSTEHIMEIDYQLMEE